MQGSKVRAPVGQQYDASAGVGVVMQYDASAGQTEGQMPAYPSYRNRTTVLALHSSLAASGSLATRLCILQCGVALRPATGLAATIPEVGGQT